MRIQNNIPAMNSYRNYTNNTNKLGANLEKLSSGYKVNRAGDDAAGLAISEKMRAQITGLDAAQKNAADGVSLVQTAEGALTEVHDMLNRMVYLAAQSANGTYQDDVDREALQEEVDQLTDEINRIAQAANFNGQTLFNGEFASSTMSLVIGESADGFNKLTFNLSNIGVSTVAADAAGKGAMTVDATSTMGKVGAASIGSAASASAAIQTFKDAINFISTERAKLGAIQNRLEHTINNLGVMEENIQDAESTIRDTDIAEEMMDYTKNNILVQSAQAMLAQANMMPQGVLQLLQ